MIGGLPRTVDQIDAVAFCDWLDARDALIVPPAAGSMLLHFLSVRGTGTVLVDRAGLLAFKGEAGPAYHAYQLGKPWTARWQRGCLKTRRRIRMREVVKRDGTDCFFCGEPVLPGHRTIEHLIPRASGGTNDPANLALACGGCNRDVGGMSLAEKIAFRDRKRAERAIRQIQEAIEASAADFTRSARDVARALQKAAPAAARAQKEAISR